MKILTIISFFILTSCLLKNEPEHDPRFNTIRQQFSKDAKTFGVDINPFDVKIAFGDVNERVKFAGVVPLVGKSRSDAEGICGTISNTNNDIAKPIAKLVAGSNFKQKYIVIKQELEGSSLGYLESLVYHELGHCVLDLSHDDSTAIMNTSGIYELSNFRFFYLKELFTKEQDSVDSIIRLNDETDLLDGLEIIYKAQYSAFEEDINHTLYFDSDSETYYSLDL